LKVTLCLTHRCNMACRYCYAGQTTKPDMSLDTAHRCIDFALDSLPAGKCLDLCMFGGEPFMRFDLLQQITSYARCREKCLGKKANISVTTNGTLITPEMVDFAKENRIRLSFSLDGPPELHDRNRRYRDQKPTCSDVIQNLEYTIIYMNDLQVNAVFEPDTIFEMPRVVEFLIRSGISMVNLSPNIKAKWPDDLHHRLPEIYQRLADFYIGSYQRGQEIFVNLLDSKMLLFVKGGYEKADMCSMGDGELAFAPSGNVYPCERFIGEDEDSFLCLGNINTGIDLSRRCLLRAHRGNHNPECVRCQLVKYCMNWCGCTNYFMSGQTDLAAPILCAMERAAITAARRTFDTLVSSGNELFLKHMYGYIESEMHRQ
jgi:uncharacterized protein